MKKNFKRYPKRDARHIELLISIAVTLSVLILYWFNLLGRVESSVYDLRFRVRGIRPTESPVKIIAIDDESLRVLGKWPWPREYFAALLDVLSEFKPAAVMFDILFMEPDDKNPENDRQLVKEIGESGNVYLPFYFNLESPAQAPDFLPSRSGRFAIGDIDKKNARYMRIASEISLPFKGVVSASRSSGFTNAVPDSDGVIRRAALLTGYGGKIFPLISFKMACDYLGADSGSVILSPGRYVTLAGENAVRVPVDRNCDMNINYTGDFGSYKPYSFALVIKSYEQVLNGQKPDIDLNGFRDSVVFVGHTATGSTDITPNPFSASFPMVGAHASVFDTIVSGNFIKDASPATEIALLLAIGLIMGIIIPRRAPVKGIIFMVLFFIFYVMLNYFLFAFEGWNLKVVYPALNIFLCDLSIVIYKYATEEKEKKKIKSIFSTYITPSVVNKILENPDMLKLGGERREMTVYFSDLSGFTTISESLEPEELVHLINEYLQAMTEIIFKYQGTLDKYEGDAIMAFWNAPVPQADHASRCCRAALECFNILEKLQLKWGSEGRPPLDMRIGINTGQMIVGNMGSSTRMDYTVMGDAVNLGARLESANKAYGTRLMVSQFTLEHIKEEFEFRELDALKVKGKKRPVLVYELLELKGELSEKRYSMLQFYEKGLAHYKSRRWHKGIESFRSALQEIPSDGPSRTYLSRCEAYRDNPPPDDWDGVWELTSK